MLHGGVMWHSQVMWLFPHDMYVITSHTVPSSFSDTVTMYMLVYLWRLLSLQPVLRLLTLGHRGEEEDKLSKLRKSLWEWTSSSSSSRYLAAQLRSASWDQNLHSAVVLLCNVQWHRARWEQIQSFKHFSDRGNDRMFHRHWSCSLINLKISQDKLIKFYFNIDFYKLKCTWLITGTKSIKSWTRTP